MSRSNASGAAIWTLAAFAAQIAASLFLNGALRPAGMLLMELCYLMNAFASFRLRCWVALGASAVGALLTVAVPNGTEPAWVGNMAVNLLFLLFYLPMERDFDRRLRAADASEQTLRLGRTWAMATLVQRGASMMGFLPYFEGQAELSVQQGAYTALFCVQMGLEVVALLAAVVSYVWMVRYLWRAKTLLAEGKV